jgi:hypothetical protein
MPPVIPKSEVEQAWNDAIMAGNVQWSRYRSTHRIYVHEGSELVSWFVKNGAPAVLSVRTVTCIAVHADRGVMVTVGNFTAAAVPATLDDVFLWVPAFSEIRFAPVDHQKPFSRRRLTVSLCMKTATNPNSRLMEGACYLTGKQEFQRTYPGVAL